MQDLGGWLLVKGVMDQEWIEQANAALDFACPPPRAASRFLGPDAFSPDQATDGDTRGGLLNLKQPYCQPFRRMFGHSAVTSRLAWMMGSGFRCSGMPCGAIIMDAQEHNTGQELHGGNRWSVEGSADFHSYELLNGRCHTDAVNVAFQLADTPPGAGGFVVLVRKTLLGCRSPACR